MEHRLEMLLLVYLCIDKFIVLICTNTNEQTLHANTEIPVGCIVVGDTVGDNEGCTVGETEGEDEGCCVVGSGVIGEDDGVAVVGLLDGVEEGIAVVGIAVVGIVVVGAIVFMMGSPIIAKSLNQQLLTPFPGWSIRMCIPCGLLSAFDGQAE